MSEDTSFATLMERVRRNDGAAWDVLVKKYWKAIQREARARLGRDLQPLVNSSDIVQQVLLDFFRQQQTPEKDPEAYELNSPAQLLGLLNRIAQRKVFNEARKAGTEKRKDIGGRVDVAVDPISPESSPSTTAGRQELLNMIFARFSAEEQQIADHVCRGYNWPEIAAQLGLNGDACRKRYTRAVERVAQELNLTAQQITELHANSSFPESNP